MTDDADRIHFGSNEATNEAMSSSEDFPLSPPFSDEIGLLDDDHPALEEGLSEQERWDRLAASLQGAKGGEGAKGSKGTNGANQRMSPYFKGGEGGKGGKGKPAEIDAFKGKRHKGRKGGEGGEGGKGSNGCEGGEGGKGRLDYIENKLDYIENWMRDAHVETDRRLTDLETEVFTEIARLNQRLNNHERVRFVHIRNQLENHRRQLNDHRKFTRELAAAVAYMAEGAHTHAPRTECSPMQVFVPMSAKGDGKGMLEDGRREG